MTPSVCQSRDDANGSSCDSRLVTPAWVLCVQVSLDAVLLKLCDPFLEPLSGKAWGKVDPRCGPAHRFPTCISILFNKACYDRMVDSELQAEPVLECSWLARRCGGVVERKRVSSTVKISRRGLNNSGLGLLITRTAASADRCILGKQLLVCCSSILLGYEAASL